MELDGCPTPHIPGNYHPRSHGLDGPDGPNNAHVTQEPFRLEIKYPLRGRLARAHIISYLEDVTKALEETHKTLSLALISSEKILDNRPIPTEVMKNCLFSNIEFN